MKSGTRGTLSNASIQSRGSGFGGGYQSSMRSTGRMSRGQPSEVIPDLLYQTQEAVGDEELDDENALTAEMTLRMENTNPTHSFKKNIYQLQEQTDWVGSQLGGVQDDISDLQDKYDVIKTRELSKVDELPGEFFPTIQLFRQQFRDFIAKQKSETFKIQKQIAIVARERNAIVEEIGDTYDKMRYIEDRLGIDRPRTEGNPRSTSADVFTVSGHSFNRATKSRTDSP
eukprot:CAMPEP_0114986000 /NCGR_PEP_ID=MMETSP0216-20121206/8186_1 /TAXON_ID=223996 /ORGANISM="Protocruzia adherens, Strain Boccale" /LENGTH=227 /DNA_ID=CAMNT_0002348393 /DNA_START=47 /DNA_END=730 /DNA_ORIENTATION=+